MLTLKAADAGILRTGEAVVSEIPMAAAEIGVVAVDTWNYHWCMTAAQRVGAMVPRMNRVLEGARRLGMSILWAPTDVASQYVGREQRERALAVPYADVPQTRELSCRFTVKLGPCMCGPGIAASGMTDTTEFTTDCTSASQTGSSPVCRDLFHLHQPGLAAPHLLGVHTNACVVGKPEAMRNLYAAVSPATWRAT